MLKCKSQVFGSINSIVKTDSYELCRLEIINLLQTNNHLIIEAMEKVLQFCLEKSKGKPMRKRNRDNLCQVQ